MGELLHPIQIALPDVRGVPRKRVSLRDRLASWCAARIEARASQAEARVAREEAIQAAIPDLYTGKDVYDTCSDVFVEAYARHFDLPAEWAPRHFAALQTMQEGYVFAKLTSAESSNVMRELQHDRSITVGDWGPLPMYDLAGKVIDGVALARWSLQSQLQGGAQVRRDTEAYNRAKATLATMIDARNVSQDIFTDEVAEDPVAEVAVSPAVPFYKSVLSWFNERLFFSVETVKDDRKELQPWVDEMKVLLGQREQVGIEARR